MNPIQKVFGDYLQKRSDVGFKLHQKNQVETETLTKVSTKLLDKVSKISKSTLGESGAKVVHSIVKGTVDIQELELIHDNTMEISHHNDEFLDETKSGVNGDIQSDKVLQYVASNIWFDLIDNMDSSDTNLMNVCKKTYSFYKKHVDSSKRWSFEYIYKYINKYLAKAYPQVSRYSSETPNINLLSKELNNRLSSQTLEEIQEPYVSGMIRDPDQIGYLEQDRIEERQKELRQCVKDKSIIQYKTEFMLRKREENHGRWVLKYKILTKERNQWIEFIKSLIWRWKLKEQTKIKFKGRGKLYSLMILIHKEYENHLVIQNKINVGNHNLYKIENPKG